MTTMQTVAEIAIRKHEMHEKLWAIVATNFDVADWHAWCFEHLEFIWC